MYHRDFLFYMLALVMILFVSISRASEITCPKDLTKINNIPIEFPAILHNEYVGKADVVFWINKNGSVSEPDIISLKLQPSGHRNKKPIGYREALLIAVGQWQYPPQLNTCRMQVTIIIKAD